MKREPTPAEDDLAVTRAVQLHDAGFSFEQIARDLDCSKEWARDVCTEVFLEERAAASLH